MFENLFEGFIFLPESIVTLRKMLVNERKIFDCVESVLRCLEKVFNIKAPKKQKNALNGVFKIKSHCDAIFKLKIEPIIYQKLHLSIQADSGFCRAELTIPY